MTFVKISPDGTIVVPEELLKEAGLTESQQAIAWFEDDKLIIATVELVWETYAKNCRNLGTESRWMSGLQKWTAFWKG